MFALQKQKCFLDAVQVFRFGYILLFAGISPYSEGPCVILVLLTTERMEN